MKIYWKEIQLFEPNTWGPFKIGWKTTQEYIAWTEKDNELLKDKRVRTKKNTKFREAIAESHRNNEIAFLQRFPYSMVVDTERTNLK